MKKFGLLLITLVISVFGLIGQNTNVPLDQIQEIANRNASALWGNVFPDDPIPYYSAQDEIIAWRFNYSINNTFPEKESLLNACESNFKSKDYDAQWGRNKYGQILMAANTSLPPILAYSPSISSEYSQRYIYDSIANEVLGKNSQLEKVYYFNDVNLWFKYSLNGQSIFLKLRPPNGIITEETFESIKLTMNPIAQEEDYTTKWDAYIAGKVSDSKGQYWIPDFQYIHKYDWSYGCTPTSAAMLFSWWDYRSIVSGNDYAKLIRGYFKRWDCRQGEWDYQVPRVQKTLAIEMETDTSCNSGSTWSYNCDNGIESTAVIQGYEMDADNKYSSKWYHVRQQIDANRPLLVHSSTHTYCAMAYNDSDETIFTYTTWDNPTEEWISKDILECITRVVPEADAGQGINLTSPTGDLTYNSTGNGEVYYPGKTYSIQWDYETSIPSTNTIYLSSNGDEIAEEVIVYNTPNDGSYVWTVPMGIDSDECRMGINNTNADGDLLGIDGTMGMFTIYHPPSIPLLSKGIVETADFSPDYYRAYHSNNDWYVMAVRNYSAEDWDMIVYDDPEFTNSVEWSSLPAGVSQVDFVVVDGHHDPDITWRIKVEAVEGETSAKVVYNENGSVYLGSNSIYFPVGSVAKMYEIHLVPGYYTFDMSLSGGSGDANMALFNSGDGDYLKDYMENMASSNHHGNGLGETFTVYITSEDDYGLCIWTPTPTSSSWDLEIFEEQPGVWEGDYNSYWSNANNWSLNIVPDITTDVVIPAGTPYNPYTMNAAYCNNITIENGASLYVSTGGLTVAGDMLNRGFLRIYSDRTLTVAGDMIWTSTSSEDLQSNSIFNVGSNWTFDVGSSIQLLEGKVRFASYTNSIIYCKSAGSYFHDVEIDKMSGAWVNYDNTPDIQPLRIYGDFDGLAGQFWCPAMYDIIFKGQDLNVTDDFEFTCTNGSFIFNGSGNQYLYFNENSYFNDLVVESGGNVYLQDPIIVEEDVIINSGVLASNSRTIEVGGDWTNNVSPSAFYQSSGLVIFNGYGTQECKGEEFNILEMDKTGGELRFHEGVTVCEEYNYTNGAMRVNGGSFTANDLTDDGIFGDIYVTAGELIFTQDISGYIDLRGNLTITDGVFTINGGADDSYWPYIQDASLSMSGGVLDFVDNGIELRSSGNFIENITGGTIRTAYDFNVLRTDFNPHRGVIELYGTTDVSLYQDSGSSFWDVLINKSSKNYIPNQITRNHRIKRTQKSGKSNTVNATTDIFMFGDFTIAAGIFTAPDNMWVGGNWDNQVGESAFIEGSGTVTFKGTTDVPAYCYGEIFNNLIIDKIHDFGIQHLIIPEGTSTICQSLEWVVGGLYVQGGNFTAFDLINNGIYGDNIIDGGDMTLFQGTANGEFVDLNGALTLEAGDINIYGGADDSYWSYNEDASLTMSGISNFWFHDVGVRVYDSPTYTFTEDITNGQILTSGDFMVDNVNFTPLGGTVRLYGPDDANISQIPGSFFYHLLIDKSSKENNHEKLPHHPRDKKPQRSGKSNTIYANSNLDINGSFDILTGTFTAPDIINLRGSWNNHVGESAFIEGSGKVIFDGEIDALIKSDEIFNNVDVEKMNSLTVQDLNDIIILNDLHLMQGAFILGTDCELTINNNISFDDDAGLIAGNSSITIGGDWDNDNTSTGSGSGFHPGTSTVIFNGMENQLFLSEVPAQEFFDLVINKTSGTGNESFEPRGNIRMLNDLDILTGNWYDTPSDNIHEFYGDINIAVDGRWTDAAGIVELLGSAPQSMINQGGGYFDIVMFNKDNATDPVTFGGNMIFDYLNINTGAVTMLDNYYLNHEAIFVEADASLILNAGAWLVSDNAAQIHVSEGGNLFVDGDIGNPCVITVNGGAGFYDFDVYGELAIEHTELRFMSAQGVNIHPTGTLNPVYAFNNCNFTDGEAEGTFLNINNNQNLTSDGVNFGLDNWGGNSNVRKTVDQGNITFINFTGDFSGEAFDDDFYDRIYWDEGYRELDLSILLEGPFGASEMETTLNTLDLIPDNQPYNTLPWNYSGTESVSSIPNPDIVDWILLEYRDAPNPASATGATMIGQQAAFILNTGEIVDIDGVSLINFPYTINDQLFVIVYHRNHIPVMSAAALTETGGIFEYDFSSSADQAYGINAMKDLGGVFAMYAGDANADDIINQTDRTSFWNNSAGQIGYISSDFSMDGQVNNKDKNDLWYLNQNTVSQIPE